jgi:hypothetical protein
MGTNRAFERCNSEFSVITGRKPSSGLLVARLGVNVGINDHI